MGTSVKPPLSTRERLIRAMQDALQRRGLHGIGLSEVLAQAQAPKGVLYHHFPGGKMALAEAAIDAAVARLLQGLDQAILDGTAPGEVLRLWLQSVSRRLEQSGFALGCPLATVALESTADDALLRAALVRGFSALRGRFADLLTGAGIAAGRAAALANLVVSAYEGALMQARVEASTAPLAQAIEMLVALIAAECALGGADRP